MLDAENWEFPDIKQQQVEAYEAVRAWLELRERWVAVKGEDTPLPIEAYVDHPAYEAVCNLLKNIGAGLIGEEQAASRAAFYLSKISTSDSGELLLFGCTHEQLPKIVSANNQIIGAALRVADLTTVIEREIDQKITSFLSLCLWDEDVFLTPLSIRLRSEVNLDQQ